MTQTVITIKGLDKLQHKITDLAQLNAVKIALINAGKHVKGKAADYPPRPHWQHRWSQNWSDKQRRYFFWALKQGKIEVPYRRGQSPGSEDLGQRWSYQIRDKGFTIVVGNRASYAPFVQSAEKQTMMHKIIGWKTIERVAEDEERTVVEYLGAAINKILNA